MTTNVFPVPFSGIQETIVDAKGDLLTATAADTPARLAVGTNNHTLIADSSAATGLSYAAGSKATLTTTGDILYASSANTPQRLGIGSSGQVLTVASGIPSWAATASSAFVGCNIYLSSNQSIATATATAIQFNAKTFDTDNFHDNSTNNTRVTIPSGKGGKYLFTAWANLETNGTGYRNLELLKNGSSLTGSWSIGFTPNAHGYAGFCGAVVINLSAGDYMEVLFTQTSGSNKNIIGSIYGATGLSCAYLGA